jgi:glycosyltransferase involved in cell wall biosynthesis
MDGVSVVVPCFNGERFLRACLDSVFRQRFAGAFEVLFGDDGSTDGSAAVAGSYGQQVRILRHPGGINRGLPATRNLCIQAARHDLIALLDADDVWLPDHLEALSTALRANPQAGLAYANGLYLGPKGSVSGPRFPPEHRGIDAEGLLLECCLVPSGVMLRRSALDEVGLFEESLHNAEDHDLWLRILERFPAVYVPAQGFLYRQHPNQITRSARLWRYAEVVVARARARGRYRPALLRKRQAVLDYRLGMCAWRDRHYLRAGWRLARAGAQDPVRAARALLRWLAPRPAQYPSRHEGSSSSPNTSSQRCVSSGDESGLAGGSAAGGACSVLVSRSQ